MEPELLVVVIHGLFFFLQLITVLETKKLKH